MHTPADTKSEQCNSPSDALTDENCSNECSKNTADVPPEILYNILADVVSGYLDFAITEPDYAMLSLEFSAGDSGGSSQTVDPDVVGVAATEELPDNVVISLLFVSYSFRDITLKILSDIFGIERTTDGSLSQSPWELVKISRRIYRLGQTRRLTLDNIADAKGVISQSWLLLAYFHLSACEGVSRAARAVPGPIESGVFKRLKKTAAKCRRIHLPVLAQRVLDRIRFFLYDSHFRGSSLVLNVHGADLLYLRHQLLQIRGGDDGLSIIEAMEEGLDELKNGEECCSLSTGKPSIVLTQDLIEISEVKSRVTILACDKRLPVRIHQKVQELLDFWSELPVVQPYRYLW